VPEKLIIFCNFYKDILIHNITTTSRMDRKSYIIEALDILRKRELQTNNIFKARAYAKVIGELQITDQKILSKSDIENIPGIGAKIKEKIHEILDTGKLEVAENLKTDKQVGILDALLNMYGVGPVKAQTLVEKHNISSIADLRVQFKADPALLNAKQAIGLKYYDDLSKRIPRAEMEKHKRRILATIHDVSASFEAEIVGSYRRGAKDSGDIDVLVTLPKAIFEAEGKALFEQVIDRFSKANDYVIEVLAKGDKKFMGICQSAPDVPARRIDVLMTSIDEYPYSILYFTGSDKFNMAMRKHAVGRGYTMNEHGMKKVRATIDPPFMTCEKDIFAFLELAYVDPEKRVDAKSITLVEK